MEKNSNQKDETEGNRFDCDFEGCKLSFTRKCCFVNHKKSHLISKRFLPEFKCSNELCNKIFCSEEHLSKHESLMNCILNNPISEIPSKQENKKNHVSFQQNAFKEREKIKSKNSNIFEISTAKEITCSDPDCFSKVKFKKYLYSDEEKER